MEIRVDKLTARQEILEISRRETYKTAKTSQEKRLLKSAALNEVVKVNKSVKAVATCLGLKGPIRLSKKKVQLNKNIKEEMNNFYCRDDMSRITAGRKETRTRGKKKMQIRYLMDTLQNLYDDIYKKEGESTALQHFFDTNHFTF